ncbi:hypothetical protein ACES2L_06055 [Bdellovibrio bacteriovorus]
MSISSAVFRNSYVGNGSTDTFPITFDFFQDEDILVKTRSALGVETTLGPGDYEITDENVILPAPLASGVKIIIKRNLSLTQLTEFRNQGEFFPEDIEDVLDRAVMLIQQLQDIADRSLKLTDTVEGFDPSLPSDIPLKPGATLIVNGTGNGVAAGPTMADVANAQANASAAANSAAAALASQEAAAESEENAADSATAAANSAAAAATSESNAAGSATAAANSATAAATSATNSANSATSSATSATNSGNSATAASASQTAAATSAANAANSATAAATSATNASNSATSAATSATAAAAARAMIVGSKTDSGLTGADQILSAPVTLVVNLTASLTSLAGIQAVTDEQALILTNKSGGATLIKNNSGSAASGQKIVTGTGGDINFADQSSLWLIYDSVAGVWRVVGGSGSGSSAIESSDLTLTASDTIAIDAISTDQSFLVQGGSAAVSLSNTPFSGTPKNLTLITLIGNNDVYPVTINFNDASNGCVGNFESITLSKYQIAKFRYYSSISRWVYVQ